MRPPSQGLDRALARIVRAQTTMERIVPGLDVAADQVLRSLTADRATGGINPALEAARAKVQKRKDDERGGQGGTSGTRRR